MARDIDREISEYRSHVQLLVTFNSEIHLIFPFIGRAGHGKVSSMLHVTLKETTLTNISSKKIANILSEDVKEVLEKYQMAYTQSTYTEPMDISPCFTQPDSEEAGILFDAMTFLLRFKESADKEVFKEVMDFIKKNTCVQQNEKGEERYYTDLAIDSYLISK